MFEVKTRFRFSSEGGVGEKTRFGLSLIHI